jgi:hypothetical protein
MDHSPTLGSVVQDLLNSFSALPPPVRRTRCLSKLMHIGHHVVLSGSEWRNPERAFACLS